MQPFKYKYIKHCPKCMHWNEPGENTYPVVPGTRAEEEVYRPCEQTYSQRQLVQEMWYLAVLYKEFMRIYLSHFGCNDDILIHPQDSADTIQRISGYLRSPRGIRECDPYFWLVIRVLQLTTARACYSHSKGAGARKPTPTASTWPSLSGLIWTVYSKSD